MISTAAIGCLLAALASTSTGADEADDSMYVVFQTLTLHFDNFSERNGVNTTLGLERSPINQWGWQAGIFRDSFGRISGYAGLNRSLYETRIRNRPLRILLTANVVHKQFHKNKNRETKVIPLPTLELSATKALFINMGVVPETPDGRNHTNGLLFVQMKLKL